MNPDLPDLSAMSADELVSELDARDHALTYWMDTERQGTELEAILKPFQPGEMYAYVPPNEGIEPARRKYLEAERVQASFKLFHLEDFVIHAEPVVAALVSREMRAPGPEACLRAKMNQLGVSLDVHLQVQVLDELRRMRLTPMLQSADAVSQLAAFEEAEADPTDQHSATVIRLMEAAHLNGFSGKKPDGPEQVKAASTLRKRIVAVREARVSAATRTLQAKLSAAKRRIDKVKRLEQLRPANPAQAGEVAEKVAAR